jgi:hypothetical protein
LNVAVSADKRAKPLFLQVVVRYIVILVSFCRHSNGLCAIVNRFAVHIALQVGTYSHRKNIIGKIEAAAMMKL